MSKTPDNFLRPPEEEIISDDDLFIRLDYSSTKYYLDDSCKKLHRNHGPAVIYNNGSVEYWRQGQLHNISGPAIETSRGKKVYYLYGRRLTHENWLLFKHKYSLDKDPENSVIRVHENYGDTES
jgi:hypothetical protein